MSEPDQEARREQQEMQRDTQLHANHVATGKQSNGPRVLEDLSVIDDGPDLDDDTLDHLHSKVVSTANLSEAEVDGMEWRHEIAGLRRRQFHPPAYGLTGYCRALAFRDASAHAEPMAPEDRIKHEGMLHIADMAVTRSEEFIGPETATKDTRESIVSSEDRGGSGGIGSRLRR